MILTRFSSKLRIDIRVEISKYHFFSKKVFQMLKFSFSAETDYKCLNPVFLFPDYHLIIPTVSETVAREIQQSNKNDDVFTM